MTQSNHDTMTAGAEGEGEDFEGYVDEGEMEAAEGSAGFDAGPEGDEWENVSRDVDGYYDPDKTEGGLYFIPSAVRLLDNSQEKIKSSALLFGELTRPALLMTSDTDKTKRKIVEFPKGATVGVWLKAGMKDLRNKAGASVWMGRNGSRPVRNRDNDMALFKVMRLKGSEKGARLELADDVRDESKIEPLNAEFPPWWLEELLDDGGVAEAEVAMKSREAKLRDKADQRINKARGGRTPQTTKAAEA